MQLVNPQYAVFIVVSADAVVSMQVPLMPEETNTFGFHARKCMHTSGHNIKMTQLPQSSF